MGDALKKVVSRAISDAAFRRQLQANPKAALKEFDLSAAEIAALTSGDPAKLTALGIDQRMSRMFAVPTEGLSGAWRFDVEDLSGVRASIDEGSGAVGGLGRVDDASGGVSVEAGDAGAGGAGGLEARDIGAGGAGGLEAGDVGAGGAGGLEAHEIGAGTGPDGLDLDRIGTEADASSLGAWETNPYGTDRLERIEGSDHTDLGAQASDTDTGVEGVDNPDQPV